MKNCDLKFTYIQKPVYDFIYLSKNLENHKKKVAFKTQSHNQLNNIKFSKRIKSSIQAFR